MLQVRIGVSFKIAAKCESQVTCSSEETAFGRMLCAWHRTYQKLDFLCTMTFAVYALKG
jgi:hypothetical protein